MENPVTHWLFPGGWSGEFGRETSLCTFLCTWSGGCSMHEEMLFAPYWQQLLFFPFLLEWRKLALDKSLLFILSTQ